MIRVEDKEFSLTKHGQEEVTRNMDLAKAYALAFSLRHRLDRDDTEAEAYFILVRLVAHYNPTLAEMHPYLCRKLWFELVNWWKWRVNFPRSRTGIALEYDFDVADPNSGPEEPHPRDVAESLIELARVEDGDMMRSYYLESKNYAQIGRETGRHLVTVRYRINRGITSIRRQLGLAGLLPSIN